VAYFDGCCGGAPMLFMIFLSSLKISLEVMPIFLYPIYLFLSFYFRLSWVQFALDFHMSNFFHCHASLLWNLCGEISKNFMEFSFSGWMDGNLHYLPVWKFSFLVGGVYMLLNHESMK
jgi:hypothetical protein